MNITRAAAVWATMASLTVCITGQCTAGQTRLFVTNNLTNNSPGGRLLEFNGTSGEFVSFVSNIDTPRGITVGPDGNLYVASANGDSILKFSLGTGGIQQSTFIAPGSGGLDSPWGLTFGNDGDLYVTSGIATSSVLRFDGSTGAFLGTFATDPQASSSATDLSFGPDGNLYMATLTHGVFRFNGQTGASLGQFIPTTNFTFAESITFGPDKNLYVATESGNSVLRYDGTTGVFMDAFVAPGSGGLNHANGVRFGPDGNLYVAGGFSDAILRYNGLSGSFMGFFASTPIDAPFCFAFVAPEPDTCLLLLIAAFMINSTRRRFDFV